MKIFQGLPSCTEIWKCQTERWMLNLHSVPGLGRRSNANSLKMLKGSAHCERWREKRGPCFQGCPWLSSPYNRTCFSSPVLLSTSSLIWAGWENGGLGRWEPRAHRAWIRATICPVPLSVEPCTFALFECVITGELWGSVPSERTIWGKLFSFT